MNLPPKTKANPKFEWRRRRCLPHREAGETLQSITFRLAQSLPVALVKQWQAELAWLGADKASHMLCERIETALDQGFGPRFLENPQIAALVEETLARFDGERYSLHV